MVWTVMNAFNTVGDPARDLMQGRSMVNRLADQIRSLGYVVDCGYDLEYIYESFGARRYQSYVIIGIKNEEGDYVYGCSEQPIEWGGLGSEAVSYLEHRNAYRSVTCKWSKAELDENWPLLRSHNPKLGDVPSRVNIQDDDLAPLALSGDLRTFGNTLPEDIVLVLKGYQGSETLSPWEFVIPHATACPCAEACEEPDVTRSSGVIHPPCTAGEVTTVGSNNADSGSSSEDD